MSAERDEVEQAIRAAVHDAYRYGIGFSIETIEKFRNRSTDPAVFDELLAHLRQHSATLWAKG